MARLRLSVLTTVALVFGIPLTQGQRFSTTRSNQGISSKSVPCNQRVQAQTITSCNQIYDPIVYTNAQPVSVAPVQDYSTIIQLAKSLNSKKCQKCGKNNCSCGAVRGGEIINKLIDALIYALVNKKDAAPASTPATSSPPPQSSGLLPAVGSVLSDVTGTVDGVLGTVSSTVASVPAVLGTVTGGLTGSSPSTSSLPTDSVPTSTSPTSTPPVDMANALPINSLLAALL